MSKPTFKDSQQAFHDAVESGRLTIAPGDDNYVGKFMYMGTWDGVDAFKNKDTRQYLPNEN